MGEPRISVHILAKENTELGRKFFLSAVEAVLEADYASDIVVVDNGCDNDIMSDVTDLLNDGFDTKGVQWSIESRPRCEDFAQLRNIALDRSREKGMTHFHWIDTDEVYPKRTLDRIKDILIKMILRQCKVGFGIL
jgi:hypothetical protein